MQGSRISPEDEGVNIFSRWTYQYLDKFLWAGSKKILEHEDIWELPSIDRVEHHHTKFEQYINTLTANRREKAGDDQTEDNYDKYGIWKASHHAFGWGYHGFYMIAVPYVVYLVAKVVTSLLLYFFLENSNAKNSMWYAAYLYALGLFVVSLIKTIFIQKYYLDATRVWIRVFSCVSLAVLKKMMALSPKARSQFTAGELTSYYVMDSMRFSYFLWYIHEIWIDPLIFIVTISMLIYYFGWCALVGVAGMTLFVPFLYFVTKRLAAVEERMSDIKDERLKLMNEVLHGIRVVKFFAWENKIRDSILGVRDKEYKELKKSAVLKSAEQFLTQSITVVGAALTFTAFSMSGGTLTSSVVFSALNVFEMMSEPLLYGPEVITGLVNSHVSAKRLAKFLSCEEVSVFPHAALTQNTTQLELTTIENESIEELAIQQSDMDSENLAIKFVDGSFSWDGSKNQLEGINLKVKKSSLVCVIGRVGSGKSTLFSSLFGDAQRTNGSITVNGVLSFSSEKPWIINTTIRENIIFGLDFDEERYKQVLTVCQLQRDLEQFANGDMTEIGENGINLSGGQQSRIALARACYSPSDIILLDSVLNAVDAHVQRSIFMECILDYLKERTRLLITHSLHYLDYADHIVVMSEGKIERQGTLEELKQDGFDLSLQFDAKEESTEQESVEYHETDIQSSTLNNENDADKDEKGKIIVAEERTKGTVHLSVIIEYFRGYGLSLCISALLFSLLAKGLQQFSSVWISFWTSDRFPAMSVESYLAVYLGIAGFSALFILVDAGIWSIGNTKTANEIHKRLIERILRAPILFFDSNPIGRIVNLVSQGKCYYTSNLFG